MIAEEQMPKEEETKERFVLPGQPIPLPNNDPAACKIKPSEFAFSQGNLNPRGAGYHLTKPLPDGKTIVSLLSNGDKYIPEVGDYVIGVVRFRSQQNYHLDINSAVEGTLGQLEFNGATKRNKPQLQIGSCMFCQVVDTPKYLPPKLSCLTNEKKEWTTGETKLCELKKGNLVYLPSSRFTYLETVLKLMSKHVSFEVAMGRNGVVWVSSLRVKNLVLISNIIGKVNQGSVDDMLPLLGDLFEK